jgi:flagellar assembly factor FliW
MNYEKPIIINLDDVPCEQGICSTGGGTAQK